MRIKFFMAALVASSVIVGSFSIAFADSVIDFGASGVSGTVSYAGGTDPLIGSAIQIEQILGIDTSSNPGVVGDCISCTVSFNTGTASGTAGTWDWGAGAGNFLTITGGIDFPGGSPNDIAAGSILLTGTFGSAEVIKSGTSFRISVLGFTDTKHQNILDEYGVIQTGPFPGTGNVTFTVAGNPDVGDAFSSIGNITNVNVSNVVPIPGTALLFGLSFAAFAVWRNKEDRLNS